ncbi:MAG TPA: alkaline phosphatase PhoX [Dehalococcoidia bacterium]|nr:alkaline phosphatase PhoX [Dehalococcoidia bacterium]
MHRFGNTSRLAAGVAALAAFAGFVGLPGAGIEGTDFGVSQENALAAKSQQLFGVKGHIRRSSTEQVSAEDATSNPLSLVTLAKGLEARVVTAGGIAGHSIDMMALWPNDTDPEYIIACNEQRTGTPGVQRINIETGTVETILTGTRNCDPMHRTSWNTIFFGEEAGGGPDGGRMYELIDPLNTTDVTLDRSTGTFSGGAGAANFAVRPALGRLSFEGLAVYPNGVVYFGDENRPATGTPGGAYNKFLPTTLRDPAAGPIADLGESPLSEGRVYGLRLGRHSDGTDYGQGTQTGLGMWVEIPSSPDPDLRAQAATLNLTGYYRPEDLAIDLAARDAGDIRMCGNNPGNEDVDQNWGETFCLTDGTIAAAASNTATPQVQYLVMGNPAINMPDNIAYQPGTGNWVIHEDAANTFGGPHNNDLWDCLDDGKDDNLQSDGCIRIGTLNDMTAEWTGGLFDATGKRFFVSVQHNITGAGTVIEITGWHVPGADRRGGNSRR